MAATMGSTYSPPSLAGHSPDTTSPIYPDRPIRPLPKRRLRSRLSAETADSINYPPVPTVSKPLFYLPYNESAYYGHNAPDSTNMTEIDQALVEAQRVCNGNLKNGYQFKGQDVDSDEEEEEGVLRRSQGQHHSAPGRAISNGLVRNESALPLNGQLSQSTISSNDSVDGYDSFENTNNKKKRKIPTSGNLGSHHSSLSTEMANMGISSHDIDSSQSESASGTAHYYGTGGPSVITSSGTGISGAGRGRYGRSSGRMANGRSPLGVSLNGSNAWQAGRSSGRREYAPTDSRGGKDHAQNSRSDQGIISEAIRNAAATPVAPTIKKDNVSLLEQQASKKDSPSKTQFTFTCESDSAKGMVWPGQYNANSTQYGGVNQPNVAQSAQAQKGFATQGTQTSPSMAGQPNQNGAANASRQAPQQTKKPRRPPGKQYAIAARQRKLQREYNNFHHPPNAEDIWICEFCEYESIFGSPPEALVRQYERKDRQERRRLAEKRRLLEKAKMKGRKGKKGNKNATKNSNAATQPQNSAGQQPYAPPPEDQDSIQHQGTQSEEYIVDDYDNDAVPMPAPSKIPQPVASGYSHSQRSAHTNGTIATAGGGMSRTAQ